MARAAFAKTLVAIVEGGSFAKAEALIMLERQRQGIAKAKGEGKYKGRKPTARAKAADAVRLFREGKRVASIAAEYRTTEPASARLATHGPTPRSRVGGHKELHRRGSR